MKCTRCGFDNPYDAHYCKQCGAPLEAAAPQGQAGSQVCCAASLYVPGRAVEPAAPDVLCPAELSALYGGCFRIEQMGCAASVHLFGRVGRPPLLCRQDRHGCDLPVDRRRLWHRLAGGRDSNRLREFHGFCGRAFEAIGISGYGANIQTGKGPFRCKWRGLLYFSSAGVGFRHRSIVYFVAGKLEKRPGMQVHS